MSTTIKRIALVAVAALGLGVVSVAPSTAAQSAAQSYIYCSYGDGGAISNTTTTGATCGGIAGSSNFVTLTAVNQAKDVEISVSGSTFSGVASSNWVINTGSAVASIAGGNTGSNNTIRVLTPTVGTITVTVKTSTANAGQFTASTETVVITVGATALSGAFSASKSSFYLVAGETFTASADDATAPMATKTYTSTDSATASIVASYVDGLGVAVRNDTLTATITSGPGVISTGALIVAGGVSYYDSRTASTLQASTPYTAASYSASAIADLQGKVAFYLFANGQAGTSVVTIKNSAGTVVATKSVVFTDTAVASIEATVLKATVQGDTAGHTSNAIKLVLKDAAGNVLKTPATYPTVTSGATTIGTASQVTSGGNDTTTAASGAVYWGVDAVGAKYGPVTYTFTAGTVTTTATVTFSSAVAATATVANVNVNAGESIAYAVTLKDANGYAIPEGIAASNYISSVVSTGGITTEVSTTSVKSVAGVLTIKGTAPLVSTTITSTITLTGTAGTADTNFAKALAGTTLTPTATVSNAAADLAIDAANDAATAAQDATDAALSAAEAAEAATDKAQQALDAVNDLAAQVNTLISALKSQIKTLSTLVTKIAKKVGA